MKSKFFGLNAKLALAVLAVGTMFTSCYDSENGDVTQPYQAPDAVYTFTGTVTSQLTNKGVAGATVTFSGAVTGTVNTDVTGTYQFTTTDVDATKTSVSVVVSGADFDTTAPVNVAGFKVVEKGQSIIFFTNVMVDLNIFEEEGLEFEASVGLEGDKEVVITSNPDDGEHYNDGIDIANNTGVTKKYALTFNVKKGTKVTDDKQNVYGYGVRALTDEMKDAIKNRINAALGQEPQPEFGEDTKTENIYLESGYAIGSVSIQYNIQTLNFDYAYDDESGSVQVQRIVSVLISPEIVPYEFFHGHSHGHGDDANAGGGIIDSEF